MTHTQTDDSAIKGDALYDSIMQYIEPELMTDQIDTLEEKYAEESLLDREARLEHYQRACEECERILDMMQVGNEAGKRLAKSVLKLESKKKEKKQKRHDVESIEEDLDSFTTTS